MADSSGTDIDKSLVQYSTCVEECTEIAQQFPTNGCLPLLPYTSPPPVVYKVYNINNPVGLQIESQGGLMTVEDPRKALENREQESKETQTNWDNDNDDEFEERKQSEEIRKRACRETPKNTQVTRFKPMPAQSTCRRVDSVSQRIVARMEVLEEQANWIKYDKFLKTAIKRHEQDSDILVRIVLEDVVAAYFREDFKGGYESLQRADDLVQKVSDPAQQQTHRLYLKSALLRKQKRHDEAENINTLALQGLPYMTPGRDTAAVWYNIAALKAQVLCECENSPDRAEELYREAVAAFQLAIEQYGSGLHSKDETCRNQLRRSHIRLAMVATGCFYDGTTTGTNPDLIAEEDLQTADNSLQEVENSLWEGIPNRMRCSWYLAKSDLFRRRGNTQRATEMAQEALRVARNGDFPSEVKFAEVRLGLLMKTAAEAEEREESEANAEEDVDDMTWLSLEEGSEDELTLDKSNGDCGSEPGNQIAVMPIDRTSAWIQSAVLLVMFFLLPVLAAVSINSLF